MKTTKTILIVLLLLAPHISPAQAVNKYDATPKSPFLYFGLGTGINSNTGLTGVKLGVRINESMLIDLSAGIGSWGNKMGLGIVFNAVNKNAWCPVVSISRATGIDNIPVNIEVDNNAGYKEIKKIDMQLNAATMLNLSIQRQWLRPSGNRMVLELGYSILANGGDYKILSNHILTDVGKATMEILKPGGLMLGFSYNFGIK